MGSLHAMIPDGSLSTSPVYTPFQEKQNRRLFPLTDWEMGGVAIGDNSLGYISHLWRMDYVDGAFIAQREGDVPPVTIFSRAGVTEIALAFDQNMRPMVAFMDGAGAWMRWYDPLAGDWAFIPLPGALNPRVTMDIKGGELQSDSDVILAYVKDNALCYRQQRDRFATEYTLKTFVGGDLVSIGRNRGNRLMFKLHPNGLPTAP